jgi:cysteine desulfurase
MLANNETGVLQPVSSVAEIAHRYGAVVHCDAVQAVGKIAVDAEALGVDMMTLSAHKLGGPMGVGALVVTDRIRLEKQMRGGGQERGRRAGTENVPGIAGFGAAAVAARGEGLADAMRVRELRDRLERGVLDTAPDARVFGASAERLPNTTCVEMPGVSSEIQVMALDLEGIAVSAGSACSSGKVRASHVLAAMGVGPGASHAIRVSLGWTTTDADIERFLKAWSGLFRRIGSKRASVVTAA